MHFIKKAPINHPNPHCKHGIISLLQSSRFVIYPKLNNKPATEPACHSGSSVASSASQEQQFFLTSILASECQLLFTNIADYRPSPSFYKLFLYRLRKDAFEQNHHIILASKEK